MDVPVGVAYIWAWVVTWDVWQDEDGTYLLFDVPSIGYTFRHPSLETERGIPPVMFHSKAAALKALDEYKRQHRPLSGEGYGIQRRKMAVHYNDPVFAPGDFDK